MTTKRDSKVARANLWVAREQLKNVAGSAQVRAAKARQLAKQAKDKAARELSAKQAAAKKKAAAAKKAEEAAEAETGPEAGANEPEEDAGGT